MFGERQTIVGSVDHPADVRASGVIRALRPALLGGISGRSVDIRPASPTTARRSRRLRRADGAGPRRPGRLLRTARRRPPPAVDRQRLAAVELPAQAQQFRADARRARRSTAGRSTCSTRSRSTAESPQLAPASSTARTSAHKRPGRPTARRCVVAGPPGTIGLRALLTASGASGDSAVPFYFQPTLGGSDLERRTAAGRVRRLPLPRAEPAGAAGEHRALALGTDRGVRRGGARHGGQARRRPRFQRPAHQRHRRPDARGRRLPDDHTVVFVGVGREPRDRNDEHVAPRRSAAELVLSSLSADLQNSALLRLP